MLLGVATSRGNWTGSICAIQHTEHIKISIFSTFSTDLILVTLMLVGVLRWREPRQNGRTWWLLYTQVSPSHLTRATLIYKSTPSIGLGMGCCSHTCRSASRSGCIHSSTDLVHMPYGRSPDFHYSGFKWCVNFSTIKRPCTQ